MSEATNITAEDILQEVKISGKMPEIIEAIITRKIVADAANEAQINIETEELQKAADQFRLMSKLETAEATHKWLEKHQLSLDDFEEMIKFSLLSGKLAHHLFAHKVEPYFYENQLDYAGVVMYEVVLDDEDLAMELFYALQEAEISFWEVAHQYIQDTELRRKLGYLGGVKRKDLKPEISAAVFAAKPPQILKPIVTAKGVHLILVEEVIQQPDLDDKRRYQILSDLFSQWLKQQIEQAD